MNERTCSNCRFRDGSERCLDCIVIRSYGSCYWQERTEAQKMVDRMETHSKLFGDLTTGYIYKEPIYTDPIRKRMRDLDSMKKVLNKKYGVSSVTEKEDNDVKTKVDYTKMYAKKTPKQKAMAEIKKVVFNDPATIVFWNDGTKTVVKADGEPFDPEKGLAMAIAKKHFGNEGYYYDIFKKWLPKEEMLPNERGIIKQETEFVFLNEFCERNNITKNKAYGMIKRKEINAFKNEAGMWMIEVPVNSDAE